MGIFLKYTVFFFLTSFQSLHQFCFLAKEKAQKSSLKSHTRVLSSHQPMRVPILIANSPYKSSDMNDGRSISGSSMTDGASESILLSDNFSELMNESVEVQLHTLLGPAALNFLKPTFRDGAKKSLDPLIEKFKTGIVWMSFLWQLRSIFVTNLCKTKIPPGQSLF